MKWKVLWLFLAAVLAWLAPALPAVLRYGALPQPGSTQNIVLAGLDVDYDWNAATWPYPAKPLDFKSRTDTLLLSQIQANGTTNILSIPRDTWVYMPEHGYGKINGANVHGGPEMLQKTIYRLTGIKPDGYLFLSLSAVKDLTDALGGVEINVPIRMKYDDNAGHLHIDLHPGKQRLNGEQVEGFLRFRHDGLSDIGRVERQQQFLKALSAQAKHPLSWWRIPFAIRALDRNMKTNLSREQIGALLGASLSGIKLNTVMLPGEFGRGGTWVAHHSELRQALSPFQPTAALKKLRQLRITVVNTDAPAGSAGRLRRQLLDAGFQDVSIVYESRYQAKTTIAGSNAAAMVDYLGYGSINGSSSRSADLTIRLGNDTP